jgi:hypothetical protein
MDGPLEGGRAGSRSPGYRQAAYRGGSSPPGATRHKWPFGCDTDGQPPEHQHVDVGDLICDRPNYAWYFRVQRVDPQRPLVYRSIRHPRRGSPIDITGPQPPRQAEQQLPEAGTYIDFAGALAPGPLAQNEPPAAWRGCQYVPGQATRRAAGLPDTAAGPGRRDRRSSDAAGDRQARGRPRTARNVACPHVGPRNGSRSPRPGCSIPCALAVTARAQGASRNRG